MLTTLVLIASMLLTSPAFSGEKVDANQGPRFDVVFVIDATGSMADEIEVVKTQVWDMATKMMDGKPKPDIRFGLVFYRDISDSVLFESVGLTRDIQTVESKLKAAQASGGGDWEEHVGRGLHEALNFEWDLDKMTTRHIYLVGDAPPHMDYDDGYSIATATSRANEIGIVIHAIGGSGLEQGSSEFEKIALATDGTFQYLTYHSVVADADGVKHSVIYEGGEYFEAEEVLSDVEWRKGAKDLKAKKKVRAADSTTASKAAAAPKVNNLDSVVNDSVMNAAEAQGVVY
ncbi:MAG: hypothetical protein AUK47_16265 [Deltaproteobacteria bacterium CG2_30_63_29]|nr:MAG: hypothetical protein AUK47_16265 [Deltaproteobacteria bacterium CG2_30_63_29]